MHRSLNTNGMLLGETPDRWRDVQMINVSLAGPPEIHDELHGAGAFANLRQGLRLAQKLRKKTNAIVVLTRQNLPYVRDTCRIAESLRVKLFFQPVHECFVSGDLPADVFPEPGAFRREIRWLIDNRRALPVASSLPFLQHLLNYPDWPLWRPCRAGEMFFEIKPDGRLTACHVHDLPDNPSILQNGVREALVRLRRPNCRGCATAPYAEFNLIASGNLKSMINACSLIR
jgi:MoaA/NifB/PqqE/SkfB family radical SAM enzyme